MRKYENVKDLVLLAASLSLTFVYFNLWPESPDIFATLAFISFSPFYAFIFRNLSRGMWYITFVVSVYFVCIGISITSHFGIDIQYGLWVGLLESLVQLSVIFLWKRKHSIVDGTLLCLLWSTWVSMDYLVALVYGIAFLPPIQLYRFPFLIQPVALLGFSLIDAFVIGINILFGLMVASAMGHRTSVPSCHRKCGIVVLGVISSWVVVCFVVQGIQGLGDLPSVKLSTISPGKKFLGDLDDMIELTSKASRIDNAQFIVWPELYINPRHTGNKTCEKYIVEEILPRLTDIDSFVVIGCDEHIDDKECPFGNLAFTVSPKGSKIIGSYGKQHPVTMIGEKSCVRNGYRSYRADGDGGRVNGKTVPIGLTFSTLICYDMDFADSPAHVADAGSHFILNPSEDWTAARGHFAASVFRAVENRVSVAKCDWGWDSVIIDPFGNLEASFATKDEHRQVLTAEVPVFPDRAGWYFLRQNVFPAACLLLLLFHAIKIVRKSSHNSGEMGLSDIEARLVGNSS